MNKYQEALDNVLKDNPKTKLTISNIHKDIGLLLELINKQSKYQAIEEELGIDLITLFKALKDGIEVGNDKMRVCIKKCQLFYRKADNEYVFIYDCYFIKLKDYGKTWWLEKSKENDDE